MTETIAAQVAALRRMTVGQLREKHREVYGEDTRSGNKDWLWKRIAWRLQEIESGGLSERARRRAAEIANEADARAIVPKGAFDGLSDGTRKAAAGGARSGAPRDPRLPAPGTVLMRRYKGRTHEARVLADGFEYEGRVFKSLSAVAKAITGSHWNGRLFFGLTNGGRR